MGLGHVKALKESYDVLKAEKEAIRLRMRILDMRFRRSAKSFSEKVLHDMYRSPEASRGAVSDQNDALQEELASLKQNVQ